mmetsp:Transcript_2258/g.5356  ORF Transcript_2258/g.5356 Transcript_2258/m.5356 type:complete len:211 (-) Transcript_2258:243-875(-)
MRRESTAKLPSARQLSTVCTTTMRRNDPRRRTCPTTTSTSPPPPHATSSELPRRTSTAARRALSRCQRRRWTWAGTTPSERWATKSWPTAGSPRTVTRSTRTPGSACVESSRKQWSAARARCAQCARTGADTEARRRGSKPPSPSHAALECEQASRSPRRHLLDLCRWIAGRGVCTGDGVRGSVRANRQSQMLFEHAAHILLLFIYLDDG